MPAARQAGSKLKIVIQRGCPPSLGTAAGVSTNFPGHDRSLLPTGLPPVSGLVCEYGPTSNGETTRLRHAVRLGRLSAQRLGAAVNRVSLARPEGVFNCPAEFYGAITVIAFGYASNHSVALWYRTSGCRTLDNGTVSAFQGANPSFYDSFETSFTSVAPAV